MKPFERNLSQNVLAEITQSNLFGFYKNVLVGISQSNLFDCIFISILVGITQSKLFDRFFINPAPLQIFFNSRVAEYEALASISNPGQIGWVLGCRYISMYWTKHISISSWGNGYFSIFFNCILRKCIDLPTVSWGNGWICPLYLEEVDRFFNCILRKWKEFPIVSWGNG